MHPSAGHAENYGNDGVYNTDVHIDNFGEKTPVTSVHWESIPTSRFPVEWNRCANERVPTARDGTNTLSNVIKPADIFRKKLFTVKAFDAHYDSFYQVYCGTARLPSPVNEQNNACCDTPFPFDNDKWPTEGQKIRADGTA